jgi:hypothetical protein
MFATPLKKQERIRAKVTSDGFIHRASSAAERRKLTASRHDAPFQLLPNRKRAAMRCSAWLAGIA